MDSDNNKEKDEVMKNIADLLIEDLNKNYCTIGDFAKRENYTDRSYISRKARKLKLGHKLKTLYLLSKEDQEILKKSIKRRGSKFSSE